jgi:hypothetical protein
MVNDGLGRRVESYVCHPLPRSTGIMKSIERMVAVDSTNGPCFALMGRTGVWTVGFALKERRIPAQSNALGFDANPFMRSERTPYPGRSSTRLLFGNRRRSFRTRPYAGHVSQSVALGWYAMSRSDMDNPAEYRPRNACDFCAETCPHFSMFLSRKRWALLRDITAHNIPALPISDLRFQKPVNHLNLVRIAELSLGFREG